ncbi:hypothetical protein F383_17024 [Gossypium arboreum]|uniref:Uncharacterized protein n=1 Tax=Gossypium arboreum TaxID=29729 RepID=A0A0B0MQ71_GOSAR|nr:hypothetical protein F383_23583 [Gossypium arboreum]KHG13669.1 hypothetical protein F383_17024 [Gossypium arboreum]
MRFIDGSLVFMFLFGMNLR